MRIVPVSTQRGTFVWEDEDQEYILREVPEYTPLPMVEGIQIVDSAV